jgi:hypothetical protein
MRRLSPYQRELLTFITALTVVPKIYLEKKFGSAVSHDLKKLKAMGLACHRRLVGKATLWQATIAGCRLVGASESRARRLGGQAIHHHVVMAYLVMMRGYRPLNRGQGPKVVQDAPANVDFLMPPPDAEQALLRVLTPGYTDPRAVARSIRKLEREYDWTGFQGRDRGYLVTADSLARKQALTAAFKRAKLYGPGFVLRVELAPSVATIQGFTHAGAAETPN